MRQGTALVADRIDVEKARARDMGGVIFGPRIAARGRHVPACIQDAQVGIVQMRRQPFGRDQRFRIVLHGPLRLGAGLIYRGPVPLAMA
ncbi:hypothetical protein GCM10017322_14580 [Paracoccus aerius]|nr:hypothetical protein GCM10017322_14580 [Paracoccus aerius]